MLVDAYIKRGNAKEYLKRYSEAIEDYNLAIQINPQSILAYFHRGWLQKKLGNKRESDLDFDRTLKIVPHSLEDYAKLRMIFEFSKDYINGVNHFSKIIEKNSQSKYAYIQRATLYDRLHKLDLAIIDRNKFLDLEDRLESQDKATILGLTTLAYLQLGKYPEAIATANQVISLDSKNCDGLIYRGRAYYNLGNYSGALNDYSTAIVNTECGWRANEVYFERGNTKAHLKDKQGAISDYEKALKINPNFTEARQNLELIKSDLGYQLSTLTSSNYFPLILSLVLGAGFGMWWTQQKSRIQGE